MSDAPPRRAPRLRAPPQEARLFVVEELGGSELFVLELPRPRRSEALLSDAERDVVEKARRGLSNQAIAAARRTSVRTVANQLASAFRKLDVSSRGDLAHLEEFPSVAE